MAGRAKRKAASLKRRAKKQALKEAKKALYASWRDAGKNKKSKRFIKKNKGANKSWATRPTILVVVLDKGEFVLANRKVHGGPACGNIGCKRCSSVWIERS